MLVLSRKVGQQIRIGDSIVLSVLDCGQNKVSIGIDAPPEVRITRPDARTQRSTPLRNPSTAKDRRILIVDDNPADRELYRRILSAADSGYEFVEADTAEAGLQLLDGAGPECVLLDFRLPDLNGLEFLEEWRRRQLPARCPVVLLTNFGSEELAADALQRGACDYLRKGSLTPELLRQRVQRALAGGNVFATSV
jgi:carbon storage regulator CsrA